MKSNEETYGKKKINKIDLEESLKGQYEDLVDSLKKELYKIKEINAVVLFGSYARGDFSHRHSDMDVMIYIDRDKKEQKLEEKIRKRIIKLGLGKEASIHVLFQYNKLEDEDKSIMLTIADEGEVLFARKTIIISQNILGLKSHFLIKFDTTKVKPVNKNKLQRFLYGYVINGKRYKGIVDGEEVISAGKGAIIVPQDLLKKVLLFSQGIGIKAIQKAKFYR